MLRVTALLLLSAMLAACAQHPAPVADASGNAATNDAAPAAATTNALAGTPLATYGHDLNRAKNVQNVVNDQAKKQAKAIDEATGGH